MNQNTSSIHEIYDHAEKMLENGKDKDAILEYLVSDDIYHTIAEEIYDEILLTKLGINRSSSNTFFAWALMVVSILVSAFSLVLLAMIFFGIAAFPKEAGFYTNENMLYPNLIKISICFFISIVSLFLVNPVYNGKVSKYWSLLFLIPFLPLSIMLLMSIYERIKNII